MVSFAASLKVTCGYRPAITNNGTSNLSGYCYKYAGGDDNDGKIIFNKKDSIVEIQVVTEGCVLETVLFFEKTPGTIFYTTIADRFKLQSKAADNRTIRYLDTDPGPGAGNFAAVVSAPLALTGTGGEGMMTGIRCDPVWEDEK